MMNDEKDDKSSPEFDEFGDKIEEPNEFFDPFEDDLDSDKPKKETSIHKEMDDFEDEFDFDEDISHKNEKHDQEHDEFHEFDDERETEIEEHDKDIEEEEEEKGDRGLIQYLKDNAIVLVVGGFFIITGITRLYTMIEGSPQEKEKIPGAAQNLHFNQNTQAPKTAAGKSKEVVKPAEPNAGTTVQNAPIPSIPMSSGQATTEGAATPATAEASSAIQSNSTSQSVAAPAPTAPAPNPVVTTGAVANTNTASPSNSNVAPAASVPHTTEANAPVVQTVPTSSAAAGVPATTTSAANLPAAQAETTQTEPAEKSKISAFFAQEQKPLPDTEFKQISERISGIETQLKEIKAIETKLTSVQTPAGTVSELEEIKNQLIQTNKIVTELSNQVRAQQTTVQNSAPVVREIREIGGTPRLAGGAFEVGTAEIFERPEPIYEIVVQAVIPGRAWLRDVKGRLLTVQVGDQIPGYGTVISIDAHKGIVRTNEHYEFRSL